MPSLPTTNLTLHCDASDTDKLFTTYNVSGVHSGVPADGGAVQVWDDEVDGIADIAMIYAASGTEPSYRSITPLMLNPCLDFDGSDDQLIAYNQIGTLTKVLSDLITNSDFTLFVAFYAESITANTAAIYNNHVVFGDNGQYMGLLLRIVSGQAKVIAYNWDGNADSVEIDISVSTSYVARIRHTGGNLYLSINGGSESSVASGNTSVLTGAPKVGFSSSGSTYFNGRIGEFAVYNINLAGSDLNDATTYFTDKWIGGSLVKTYKGLATNLVKTVKGLAIASRKTKKGLA